MTASSTRGATGAYGQRPPTEYPLCHPGHPAPAPASAGASGPPRLVFAIHTPHREPGDDARARYEVEEGQAAYNVVIDELGALSCDCPRFRSCWECRHVDLLEALGELDFGALAAEGGEA